MTILVEHHRGRIGFFVIFAPYVRRVVDAIVAALILRYAAITSALHGAHPVTHHRSRGTDHSNIVTKKKWGKGGGQRGEHQASG